MAAGAWVVYNEARLALGKKLVNLSGPDTLKIALFTSASNAANAALATAQYATLTNQVANQGAPGYATGGATAAGTFTDSSGTETFDVADVSWTATGGSIVAKTAVLYDDTATNKDLIAYFLLDSGGADVTVTVGNVLQIQINAAGVFTLTQT